MACANGTDALQLALMTWDIGNGDAVFVPDFTFFSSGEVVPLVGATPIFVDIDPETYNISPKALEESIQYVLEKTDLTPKVIVAVDLFGQSADYEEIGKIAKKYNLYILEDAAQGFGGSIGDRKACSFGDISTTSFSRRSLWDVMEMEELFLQIMMNGQRYCVLYACTGKGQTSMTTCGLA